MSSSLARSFYSSFCDAFSRECEASREAVLPRWLEKSDWTNFMLEEAGGFLPRLAQTWAARTWNEECHPKSEWLKFDLMLVSVATGKEWWQSVPLLTLEHENDNKIQDEVWKLACWRSRLKVLVTYHDSGDQTAQKLNLAASIIRNIDDQAEWLYVSAPRTWIPPLAWEGHEWVDREWRSLNR